MNDLEHSRWIREQHKLIIESYMSGGIDIGIAIGRIVDLQRIVRARATSKGEGIPMGVYGPLDNSIMELVQMDQGPEEELR